MPKYEDYPFYDLLLDKVSEPVNKVISAVKDKIGSVVDYDTASDLVTFNPNEYTFEIFRSAIIADNLMDHMDMFRDNIDAINAYIKEWKKYITKIKVSPLGSSTFLVIDSEAFVDSNGFIDYSGKIFEYDNLVIHHDGMPDKVEYDPEEMHFLMVVRLGGTDSEFKKNDYPLMLKLLEDSGLDFGAVNDYKNEDHVISESGDIDIIINANRPKEELE